MFSEITFMLFWGSVLTINIMTLNDYYGFRTLILNDQLLINPDQERPLENKKIWVLGQSIQSYYGNSLGGPFLNWKLAAPVFQHPGSYKSLSIVYAALKENQPQVIIDPNDYMKDFWPRMPDIAVEYMKYGDQYRRR